MNWVLGAGFTGKIFLNKNPDWRGTNRTGPFALDTSKGVFPRISGQTALVTFALGKESEAQFQAFKFWLLQNFSQCFLLSTTGAFAGSGVLNESSALSPSLRFQREEELRLGGANVLYLSGIYNTERNPMNWLQKQLIPAFRKSVRLIHTADLVKIILKLNAEFEPCERWILSDGINHLWVDIESFAIENRILPKNYSRPEQGAERAEKNLNITKLKEKMGREFKFLSLQEGLLNEV